MEPARSIIERLGGEAAVAAANGTALTAPYRWQHSKTKGGTGGLIPQRHHQVLLDFAKSKGLMLEAKDFLASKNSEAAVFKGEAA